MKIIVAVDKNWAIGKNGDLLLRIDEDLKRFREITIGNVIILGRKTLETFPNKKPLVDRINIIVTRNSVYKNKKAVVCKSIEEAVEESKKYVDKDTFVVGGGQIYNQMIDMCDTAIVTKIDYDFENADTFIMNFDESEDWYISEMSDIFYQQNIPFRYITYKRK